MSLNHKGCLKGFSWQGPCQSLGDSIVDELNIGFYADEGGTSGEFTIQWEKLSGNIVPRLQAFDDGWDALVNMPELLEFMASIDGQHLPIGKFVEKLKEIGFQDYTKREPSS